MIGVVIWWWYGTTDQITMSSKFVNIARKPYFIRSVIFDLHIQGTPYIQDGTMNSINMLCAIVVVQSLLFATNFPIYET